MLFPNKENNRSFNDSSHILRQVDPDQKKWDYVIAIGGNPNTGKSTVFNALTGLRQHTGNWPGKTVTRAEGSFQYDNRRYKLVDLPGTYSLLTASVDEEVARNFILFGQPDCTIIVVDATCIERNLNLVLQVLEITDKVVIALNLGDEAKRKGILIDHEKLSRELGVPVVPTVAKTKKGLENLLTTVAGVVGGQIRTMPYRIQSKGELKQVVDELVPMVQSVFPSLPNSRWVALRLLDGDPDIRQAMLDGKLMALSARNKRAVNLESEKIATRDILTRADQLRRSLNVTFHDKIIEAIFSDAERISGSVIQKKSSPYRQRDERIDRLLTSPITGLPIMALGLAVVFWLTITGANYPSQWIAHVLFGMEDKASLLFERMGAPWWLTGFLWHGVYRGLAWVVSVMLPPMAIFFPIFTILEDWGFLPRVAFNMDRVFKKAGAHGKQALTMSMGFGCNAAGVISARIIDSPRERLIAILTNNFVICNGRFPTLIMLANVFVAASFRPALASLAAAGSVMAVVFLGILMTILVSSVLSRTILKGEASSFTLELPPFRRPSIMRVIYTSLIDRTLFVLYRAIIMAAPAGGVIWLLGNIYVNGQNLTAWISNFLNPFGVAIGLDGVILLAYIVAIPANEIVVPTILMAYAGSNMMFELESMSELHNLLVVQQNWTLLTAVCLMLFSLLHNPCSTAIWTIWKETRSIKWTLVGALMPLAVGLVVCFTVAQAARWLGFG